MNIIKVKNIDSLDKVYEDILSSIDNNKKVKAGGAQVLFPDRDKNICELSATYIIKTGRFSKEQRVVVVMTFRRESDGAYVSKLEESVFHLVENRNRGLEEIWSGKLDEAMDKIGEVARMHCQVIQSLLN
ncbi:MAG: hypothetical protein ACUVQ0_02915 [Thermoproteota archaeon]